MKSSSPANPQKSWGGIPMRPNTPADSSESRELHGLDGWITAVCPLFFDIIFFATTVVPIRLRKERPPLQTPVLCREGGPLCLCRVSKLLNNVAGGMSSTSSAKRVTNKLKCAQTAVRLFEGFRRVAQICTARQQLTLERGGSAKVNLEAALFISRLFAP